MNEPGTNLLKIELNCIELRSLFKIASDSLHVQLLKTVMDHNCRGHMFAVTSSIKS